MAVMAMLAMLALMGTVALAGVAALPLALRRVPAWNGARQPE